MADFFQILWRRRRRLQVPHELNQYPATPPGFYTGYYPASSITLSNKVEFRVRHQFLPELNVYPATSSVVEYSAIFVPEFKATNNNTNRSVQVVEHDDYPEIILDSANYPAWEVSFNRTENNTNRRLIGVEQDEYPETPLTAASYPAWNLEKSNYVEHDATLQVLPELNVYPVTPTFENSGYYPGSALAESNRASRRIKRQDLPELNVYPKTPVPEQPMTAFLMPEAFARHEKRRHLALPDLDEHLATFVIVIPGLIYNIPGKGLIYTIDGSKVV